MSRSLSSLCMQTDDEPRPHSLFALDLQRAVVGLKNLSALIQADPQPSPLGAAERSKQRGDRLRLHATAVIFDDDLRDIADRIGLHHDAAALPDRVLGVQNQV